MNNLTQSSCHSRREAALTEFGLFALRESNLDSILREACERASDGLGQPIVKVSLAQDDKDDLRLIAQIGLSHEIAACGDLIPRGSGSAMGYAIQTKEPIVSKVATEQRFKPSEIVIRGGVIVSV